MVRVKSGEGVCLQAFPSPPSPPSFIFLLSFHFSRGQNRKSHSSVFLCSETTRKLKKMNSRCALSRLFHLVHFNNNIACKTVSKPEVQEKKKKVVVLSMCPRSPEKDEIRQFYVLRAVTAKKSTKKRDARAKLLFCQSDPIAFIPFSLPSPSSLVKLSLISIKPSCDMILSIDSKLRKGTLSKGLFNTCTKTISFHYQFSISLSRVGE